MAKSVDDRGRGARMARRDEGVYCWYVTEEQRSQSGCIGREGDRLSHSRALRHAELLQLLVQPFTRDAESLGGGGLVVAVLAERLDQDVTLHLIDHLFE